MLADPPQMHRSMQQIAFGVGEGPWLEKQSRKKCRSKWSHTTWRHIQGGGGKKNPGNGIQFFLRSQPPEGGGGTQIFSLHI